MFKCLICKTVPCSCSTTALETRPAARESKTEKMGMHFVLLGLLYLCGLAFSQECRPELVENIDFPGTDIKFVYSPDAEHCQQLCTQHHACQFFTFVRLDWTRDNRHFYCYLKSTSSGRPNVRTPLSGVTSGFSLKNCNPDQKLCLTKVYQNVDFFGADYRTLFTADYEECQRTCTQDPFCQFFTFVNGDFTPEKIRFKCHLKFSWTIPRTPIVALLPNLVSGFSHDVKHFESQFYPGCQSKLFPSTDIPGNDVEVLPAVSAEHCFSLCSANPQCTYFSYDRSSNKFDCHLKNNPHEMVTQAKDRITSGLPARFCQIDNSWIKVAHEGVDFTGSDMRFILLDDPETCQKTCTDDPNCHFYTYVYPNFSGAVHRRRCYLKRSITMPAPPKVNKLANVVSGFSLKNCVGSSQNTPTIK